MTLKAFKFRCYPNQMQRELIAKTFGCSRFVYNQLLAEQKEQDTRWLEEVKQVEAGLRSKESIEKRFFKKMDNIKKIPLLKKEFPFLEEVDSISLQATVEQLADGYDRYYKKQNGQPKFKSKKNPVQSYTTKSVNGNIAILNNRIKLPKLGMLRFAKSREVTGCIKRVFIRQNAAGKYFISVLADTEVSSLPVTEKAIGIDLGLSSFATLSNGEIIRNERFFVTLESKLHKAQKVLSRRIRLAKERGVSLRDAKNVQKQRKVVARIHEKIANKRNDFLHKLSTNLIKNHDIVCLETLRVSELLEKQVLSKHISKHISDVSWSTFVTMLQYKAIWYGKQVVQVDPFYPSSQRCSVCHEKNTAVKALSIREWTCPSCHAKHHRDKNAAQNILHEGMRLLTVGTTGIA